MYHGDSDQWRKGITRHMFESIIFSSVGLIRASSLLFIYNILIRHRHTQRQVPYYCTKLKARNKDILNYGIQRNENKCIRKSVDDVLQITTISLILYHTYVLIQCNNRFCNTHILEC